MDTRWVVANRRRLMLAVGPALIVSGVLLIAVALGRGKGNEASALAWQGRMDGVRGMDLVWPGLICAAVGTGLLGWGLTEHLRRGPEESPRSAPGSVGQSPRPRHRLAVNHPVDLAATDLER